MADFDFIPFDGRQDLIEFTDGNSGEAFYYSADGDEYYNAKGEKVKDFFKKFGKGVGKGFKGIGKGIKKIANAIKEAKRKRVEKNKNKVAGTSEKKGTDLPSWLLPNKDGSTTSNNALVQQKTEDGKDIFTKILPKANANTPADKVVDIAGQKISAVDVPPNTPIVVSTDPKTGEKIVGTDLKPQDVTAIKEGDGTYSYYPANQVQGGTTDANKGMSSTMKIGLVVGGVAVLGVIVYLITKKK